ncbi:MAG: TIGR04211 family SH3 domain-containing protein [Gammaproteobacteria bacterium]|uniref:SH3 domain protein n=1 Tax=endosymbiont of Bathymodiolus septemdierum str. Myojin knoll TaxID=1303921 RepID=A0A0P0UR41_9GAMM|nr:TIGR04211 family SH3 domain-containing protein [Bathymodiolus septemdierum thioautotrophic gill symbiont]RUA07015.1 MAG: TIGR04211 family SH3 domain-containing protein [Gammaproteobacteria bacterium]BAS67540.1 SH3 domain protein [endosymbiont of Bathymodiolus septemdierum str. Myojin knoll]
MKLKYLLLLPLLSLHSITNASSFVYVTDTVPIPMRSENIIQNNPSNLIKLLDSGTKLEILSTEKGWTKVKHDNTIGWMISRYLTSNVPAIVQLEELKRSSNNSQRSLSKQNERNKTLEKDIARLKKENAILSIQNGKLESEKKHIQDTYKNALKLEYKNKNLEAQVLQLTAKLQLLKNNNTIDQDSSSRNWFIVGALVLFFGFMIGFVIPKRTNNQRRF